MNDFVILKDYYLGSVTVDVSKLGVVVCDIDGTVADLSHRLHYVQGNPKNWGAFLSYEAMKDDQPIAWVIDFLRYLEDRAVTIVMCSGRNSSCQDATKDWLGTHNVPYHDLYMRGFQDYRQDSIVKAELADRILKRYGSIDLVLDDRTQVVNMWRDRGLNCIQVNFGDF